MPSWGDYSCVECQHIVEFKKVYGQDFPDKIKQRCEFCDSTQDFVRIFLSVPVVSIAEGSTGVGAIYHPSPFTPMNIAHKGGRSSMFNKDGTVTGSINYKPTG